MAELTVWAVVYSNYEPPEVASLYDNEEAAREHAEDLGDPWDVTRWPVASTYQKVATDG